MKEKWQVIPKRIGRSRKIQVRQFEPEEIWIEYELDVEEGSLAKEAVQEATKLAVAYLDEEEKRLRDKVKQHKDTLKEKPIVEYGLEITNEGKNLGNFLSEGFFGLHWVRLLKRANLDEKSKG